PPRTTSCSGTPKPPGRCSVTHTRLSLPVLFVTGNVTSASKVPVQPLHGSLTTVPRPTSISFAVQGKVLRSLAHAMEPKCLPSRKAAAAAPSAAAWKKARRVQPGLGGGPGSGSAGFPVGSAVSTALSVGSDAVSVGSPASAP